MKLTKKLIRDTIGDAHISSRLFGDGYTVELPTGSRMTVTPKEIKNMRGGADIYDAAARLAKAMGWQVLIARGGQIEQTAHAMLSGQMAGLTVKTGASERFFGLIEDPPLALPRPSGVFGSQGLGWTAADLT